MADTILRFQISGDTAIEFELAREKMAEGLHGAKLSPQGVLLIALRAYLAAPDVKDEWALPKEVD